MRTWYISEKWVLWTQFLHDYALHSLVGFQSFPWQIQEHFQSIPIPPCHSTWDRNTYLSDPGSNCLLALPGVTPSAHSKKKHWYLLSSSHKRMLTLSPVTWSLEAQECNWTLRRATLRVKRTEPNFQPNPVYQETAEGKCIHEGWPEGCGVHLPWNLPVWAGSAHRPRHPGLILIP